MRNKYIVLLVSLCVPAQLMAETPQDAEALTHIAALHRQDIDATLHSDPNDLADLWDADGVLLGDGEPAVIGKPALLKAYKSGGGKVLQYRPNITNIVVSGDTAVEWGEFDAIFQGAAGHADTPLHARFLRTMKREADQSWKFTRVMWQSVNPR